MNTSMHKLKCPDASGQAKQRAYQNSWQGVSLLRNSVAAALLSAVGAGCAPSEDNAFFEEKERQFQEIVETTRVPEFTITPTIVQMPSRLRGRMSEEEFRALARKITERAIHLFEKTPLPKQIVTAECDQECYGIKSFEYEKKIIALFSESDPRIAADLASYFDFSSIQSWKEHVVYINAFFAVEGYNFNFISQRGENSKDPDLNFYEMKSSSIVAIDDGFNLAEISIEHLGSRLQSTRVSTHNYAGVYYPAQEFAYIFEASMDQALDEEYHGFNNWDEQRQQIDQKEVTRIKNEETIFHEVTHHLDNKTYKIRTLDNIECPIPTKYQWLLNPLGKKNTVSPGQLTELSAYGAQFARTKILNEFIYIDLSEEKNLAADMVLVYGTILAAPESEIKEEFRRNWINGENFKGFNRLVLDPNWTLEHTHQVGTFMYGVARELQEQCQKNILQIHPDQ